MGSQSFRLEHDQKSLRSSWVLPSVAELVLSQGQKQSEVKL